MLPIIIAGSTKQRPAQAGDFGQASNYGDLKRLQVRRSLKILFSAVGGPKSISSTGISISIEPGQPGHTGPKGQTILAMVFLCISFHYTEAIFQQWQQ